jgi:hypothetical protein
MKKIHYRNIGYPKTGTTWLSLQLGRNPFIDAQVNNILKEFRPDSFEEYKNLYKDYQISFNMDTTAFMFCPDESHYLRPENMHTYTTHITMSLRNPYEWLNSIYNFTRNTKPDSSKESYLDTNGYIFEQYLNMSKIFEYWSRCKLPIKYLFYDDLCEDPKKYVHDVCSYIGIPPYYSNVKFLLKTEINDPLVIEDKKIIEYINDSISLIEEKTDRDLSSWKK